MHLILVSNRLATAKTVTVTPRLLMVVASCLVLGVIAVSSLFSYLTVRHAAEIRLPFVQQMVREAKLEDSRRSNAFVRENLKAMAVKVGELQARLVHLDSMGERMAQVVGIKPQEIKVQPTNAISTTLPVKAQKASYEGRGGPLVTPTPLSVDDLKRSLDDLSREVDLHTDTLTLIDSRLFDERVRKSMLPTSLPINAGWNASTFGWRIDPFTGERAMHEGVDFPVEPGSPIMAAAAGIVVSAEFHRDYGNVVEIDHGNDLTTRYAHASRLLVKAGSIVRRGQVIAEAGNTGRSTGPHLHFEVRFRGAAQNPNSFLERASSSPTRVARR